MQTKYFINGHFILGYCWRDADVPMGVVAVASRVVEKENIKTRKINGHAVLADIDVLQWQAYFGPAYGSDALTDVGWIASHGAKLRQREAVSFFPQFRHIQYKTTDATIFSGVLTSLGEDLANIDKSKD